MNYIGFQLGHPEITVPREALQNDTLPMTYWNLLQRVVAALALIALFPIITIMWLAVKLTSKGDFLFQQDRKGLDKQTFKVYKVRTMVLGSETKTTLGVTNGDPRVTRVGRILRALKLDELPQLWNVVKGDMALVGPRPIPLTLDKELREKIPGFSMRYQALPGLTSIGQICVKDNALGDALVMDWKLRFEGELHYLRNRSVGYDLLMIGMTIIYVLKVFLGKRSNFKAKNA